MQHGCRKAAELVSKSLDAPLTGLERLRLRWHLWQCNGCRRFSDQSQWLRKANRQWRSYSESD